MEYTPPVILKSIKPIELVKDISDETHEYLAKFLQDDVFYNFLEVQRSKSKGLPLDIKLYIGKNLEDIDIFKNMFIKDSLDFTVDYILEKVGLPKDFHIQLLLLIYFNAFIDINYLEGFVPKDIYFVTGNKNIINKVLDSKYELSSILLPFVTSQRQLNAYIKENWKDIKKQMDANLSQNPYVKRLHVNTEIAMEITFLKESKGLSFDEIADNDDFAEKYEKEQPKVRDTNWIKGTYYDFKALFSPLQQ